MQHDPVHGHLEINPSEFTGTFSEGRVKRIASLILGSVWLAFLQMLDSFCLFALTLHASTSEADVEAVMDKLFDELAQKQNDLTRPRILKVQGRGLRVNKACGTVADFTFEELCDRASISMANLEPAQKTSALMINALVQGHFS
ncbi:UNVERIFIED_CONTAM: hypothetical protein K2H54_069096 [Gekko kuhli]